MYKNTLSLDARQAIATNAIRFKYRPLVTNSRFITKKNMTRIVAFRLTPMGSNIRDRNIDPAVPYYELWRLVKESDGYIFREITHGMGIGKYKTILQTVRAASVHTDIVIVLLSEKELGSLDVPATGGAVPG